MAARPVPPPPADIAEQRSRIDEAMAQMPLAEGTVSEPFVRSGVAGIECRPVELADNAPILLYFHGGGFRIASALAYRSYGSHLAAVLGARVMLVEYRLAPEHKFPKAVDDCFAVWESLLAEGIDTGRIVIAGDSAGGGLAASVTMHALADGVQIDVSEVAREAGLKFPVYLTRAVWENYVRVPDGVRCQDEKGRLWDIVWMLRCAARHTSGPEMSFRLHVRNDNRDRTPPLVTLKAVCGPRDIDDSAPAITIMLRDED